MNKIEQDSSITAGLNNLCEKLAKSANQATKFFECMLEDNGGYGSEASDVSCYFKSPRMFIAAGKPDTARRVLTYIHQTFMLKNGDFGNADHVKSVKPEYMQYWAYLNGWIVRAAFELNMPEIYEPGMRYLSQYYAGEDAGFFTNNIDSDSTMTDVLTTANLGLVYLDMDHYELAVSAGNYLVNVLAHQPRIQQGLYLHFDETGAPVMDYPRELSAFYFLDKTATDQFHFMTGYPGAYLAKLYNSTHDSKFLLAAKQYVDYSLSCHESVYTNNLSHKLAWAASELYKITREEKYRAALEKITSFIITTQSSSGLWYEGADINTRFDQSAEIASWFLIIRQNLESVMNETAVA